MYFKFIQVHNTGRNRTQSPPAMLLQLCQTAALCTQAPLPRNPKIQQAEILQWVDYSNHKLN